LAKPVKRRTVRARPARKNGRGCGAGIALLSSTQITRRFPPLLWFASFKPFPSKMGCHGVLPEILPVRGGRPPAGGGRQAGRAPKWFDKGRCWPAWCWEPGGGESVLKIFSKKGPPAALFGFVLARPPLPLRKGATCQLVATKAGPALPFQKISLAPFATVGYYHLWAFCRY